MNINEDKNWKTRNLSLKLMHLKIRLRSESNFVFGAIKNRCNLLLYLHPINNYHDNSHWQLFARYVIN